MLENREGQPVPQVTFRTREGNEWRDVTTDDLFKGKTVVVFALPGAFTPTCSSTHLPRYNELAPVLKANGVDDIVCLSVNDGFVMNAWAGDQSAGNIRFIPDGNGEFTDKMGMLVDKQDLGFGPRSWRYSMLVKDGVIDRMFIEPEKPGDPFEVSDADTMLNYINGEAALPKRVTVFTKPGCPHCTRAKKALADNGYAFEEIELGSRGLSYSSLAAVTGAGTTPQVYIEGERIGGADELADVPASAGLVLDLLLAEGVRLIGKMPAEDDAVRPHVADDVRGEVGSQRRQEGAFGAAEPTSEQAFDSTRIAEAARPTQARGDPRLLALAKAATTSELCQRERAGADDRPADVVLDDLLAGLARDGLEVVFEVRHRLVAAEQRLDVGVVHGDAPLEQHHEQEVVERLAEVPGPPLLVRVDPHDLVAEILVLAADVGEGVVDVVVGVLPRFGTRRGVPVPHRGVDVGIVHPVPLSMQDVVAELHVLQDLGHAQAGRAEQPRGRRT